RLVAGAGYLPRVLEMPFGEPESLLRRLDVTGRDYGPMELEMPLRLGIRPGVVAGGAGVDAPKRVGVVELVARFIVGVGREVLPLQNQPARILGRGGRECGGSDDERCRDGEEHGSDAHGPSSRGWR